MKHVSSKWIGLIAMAATSITFSTSAFAQSSECAQDADCGDGYVCEMSTETCPPIIVEPCTEGGECPDPPEDTCEPQTNSYCVAAPPESCDPAQGASACGGGLTCVSYTFEQCTGSTGDSPVPAEDGDEGEGSDSEEDPEPDVMSECTTETESYCVPPYFAECEAAADCGPGFDCVAEQECAPCAVTIVDCGPDDEDCDAEPDTSQCDDTCSPTGANVCQFRETTCDTDADCDAGLVCADPYGGQNTSPPPSPPCTDDQECDDDPGMVPEPGNESNYCLPVGWERWVNEGVSGGSGSPSYEDVVADATGKSSGEGWNVVDSDANAPISPMPNLGDDTSAPNADGDDDESGCQATGSLANSAGTGLGALGLLGMLFGFRRRRQR